MLWRYLQITPSGCLSEPDKRQTAGKGRIQTLKEGGEHKTNHLQRRNTYKSLQIFLQQRFTHFILLTKSDKYERILFGVNSVHWKIISSLILMLWVMPGNVLCGRICRLPGLGLWVYEMVHNGMTVGSVQLIYIDNSMGRWQMTGPFLPQTRLKENIGKFSCMSLHETMSFPATEWAVQAFCLVFSISSSH